MVMRRVLDFFSFYTNIINMKNAYKIRVPDTITRHSLKQKLFEAGLTEYSNNEILVDKMLYVIYTLHRKLLFDGIVGDASNELINLKAVYLKNNLGRSGGVNYKDVIECLKKIKLLQVRESYLSGEFTKGYGLIMDIDYDVHSLELLRWNPLGKSIVQNDSIISKIKDATRENLKRIRVDTNYINELTQREIDPFVKTYYKYFVKSLVSENDLDIYTETDDYGRLHHNLTGAAKELRPALSVYGEEIHSVDISASQLYFSIKGFEAYLKMKANTTNLYQAKDKFPDSTLFINSVLSGNFYRSINQKLQLSDEDLRKNKINILMPIFSQKDPKRRSKYFKALTDMFPTYMDYVKTLKKDNYEDAARHLQRVESGIVIGKIAARLIEENIWFLTVHDAVLCTKDDIDRVYRIIQDEGLKYTGYQPNLKSLLWSGAKIDFSPSVSIEERRKRTSAALHKHWQRKDERKQKRILRRIKDKNRTIYSEGI